VRSLDTVAITIDKIITKTNRNRRMKNGKAKMSELQWYGRHGFLYTWGFWHGKRLRYVPWNGRDSDSWFQKMPDMWGVWKGQGWKDEKYGATKMVPDGETTEKCPYCGGRGKIKSYE